MFFTLQQMRHNRESERRWEELVSQIRQDFQAQQAAYRSDQAAYRADQAAYQARQEESQQQIAALLMQNQQINARLLELLERRNGAAAGASD